MLDLHRHLLLFKRVTVQHLTEPFRRAFRRALHGVVVDVDESKPLCVAVGPFCNKGQHAAG